MRWGGKAMSLLVGEPYYGPTPELRDAVSRAAREGCRLYSQPQGSEGLRNKICEWEAQRGVSVEPAQVVVGNGSKSLLFGLLSILGGRGVIVPTPTYPAMLVQPRLLGFALTTIPTVAPGFRLDEDADLSPADAAEGGCLVVGHPANPTGAVYNTARQQFLIEWCRSREVRLIVDEVYCDLCFDETIQSFAAGDRGRSTVVVKSLSKSHGICGWRWGYALCDRQTAKRLVAWQSATLNPPSTLVQRAAELALPGAAGDLDGRRRYYAETADLLVKLLREHGLLAVAPDGGLGVFADVSRLVESRDLATSQEWCEKLAEEQGVGLWPGEDFGAPGWIRASFGAIAPDDRGDFLGTLGERMKRFTNR
jgi:aspartate aminotransferase